MVLCKLKELRNNSRQLLGRSISIGACFDVIEVKRNPDKFNKGLLEEKTDYYSSKEKQARKNKIVLSSLSMDDM